MIIIKPSTFQTAFGVFNILYMVNLKYSPNVQPLINVNSEGEYVFEYWFEDRKLSIYINETKLHYIKVYGADADNEMKDGYLDYLSDDIFEELDSLWQWLINNNEHSIY